MSINPITRWREERGLSRADLARQAGVSYTTLCYAELGYTRHIPRGLADGLRRIGADVDTLRLEYACWQRGGAEAGE